MHPERKKRLELGPTGRSSESWLHGGRGHASGLPWEISLLLAGFSLPICPKRTLVSTILEAPPAPPDSTPAAPSCSTRSSGKVVPPPSAPPRISQLPIWGSWGLCHPPTGASAMTSISGSGWTPCTPDGPALPGHSPATEMMDLLSSGTVCRVVGTAHSAWLTTFVCCVCRDLL